VISTLADTASIHWLAPLLAAPFVGSFLALVAVRLPAGRPVAAGRSACPHCGRTLAILDLIPIASWLALGGRCRSCRAAIDPLHPAVEGAAVAVAAWSLAAAPGWVAWVGCGLGWALLVLAAIDWRAHVLPDEITLPLVAGGLVVAALAWPDELVDRLIGATAGFAAFAAVAWTYWRLRGRRGLGLGDAKLTAAAGAWVSWTGLPSVVTIAAVAALAVVAARRAAGRKVGRAEPVAFGPYLALGLWWVWLYGPIRLAGAG
jgi:leader peptidase (prepilin peptidase)/N-methyltransferase